MSQESRQSEEQPALPMDSIDMAPAVPLMVICKRCRLVTEDAITCVHCLAVLQPHLLPAANVSSRSVSNPLRTLLIAYVLFLFTSIVFAMMIHGNKTMSEVDQENILIVVQGVDTVITLSLFLFLGRQHVRKPKVWKRVTAWTMAPVFSLGCYLFAHWYIESLKRYISSDWLLRGGAMQFNLFEVLSTAVQPALVEELFFRYFAYGVMRQLTNAHSAVILTALMFALAHLYNPFGLPFLFAMGMMLGYARVYSGGLLLPILMHFVHNLAIIYFESLK